MATNSAVEEKEYHSIRNYQLSRQRESEHSNQITLEFDSILKEKFDLETLERLVHIFEKLGHEWIIRTMKEAIHDKKKCEDNNNTYQPDHDPLWEEWQSQKAIYLNNPIIGPLKKKIELYPDPGRFPQNHEYIKTLECVNTYYCKQAKQSDSSLSLHPLHDENSNILYNGPVRGILNNGMIYYVKYIQNIEQNECDPFMILANLLNIDLTSILFMLQEIKGLKQKCIYLYCKETQMNEIQINDPIKIKYHERLLSLKSKNVNLWTNNDCFIYLISYFKDKYYQKELTWKKVWFFIECLIKYTKEKGAHDIKSILSVLSLLSYPKGHKVQFRKIILNKLCKEYKLKENQFAGKELIKQWANDLFQKFYSNFNHQTDHNHNNDKINRYLFVQEIKIKQSLSDKSIIHIPSKRKGIRVNCIDDEINQEIIHEKFENSKQLRSYLKYTVRLQQIDGLYKVFKIKNNKSGNFEKRVIFNTELHKKHSNEILYIDGIENVINKTGPKWKINVEDSFMTGRKIHELYGISLECLPNGSRLYRQSTIVQGYIKTIFDTPFPTNLIHNFMPFNLFIGIDSKKYYIDINIPKAVYCTLPRKQSGKNKLFKKEWIEMTADHFYNECVINAIKSSDIKHELISIAPFDGCCHGHYDLLLPIKLTDNEWNGIVFRDFKPILLISDCDDIKTQIKLFNASYDMDKYKWMKNGKNLKFVKLK